MNIECPHFSISQDIVTNYVCQSITVLTVSHQAPRGLAVMFDTKNCAVQDVGGRAKTDQQSICVLHMCTAHAEMHIVIKKRSLHVMANACTYY